MTTIDLVPPANWKILALWVEEASAGLLTASQDDVAGYYSIRIARVDGAPLNPTGGSDGQPLTATLKMVTLPYGKRLDRRHKIAMREVVEGVRFTVSHMMATNPKDAGEVSLAAWDWERRWNLTTTTKKG